MTARVPRMVQGSIDSPSVGNLFDASMHPNGAVSLTFPDGVVHVMLDKTGDWTITAGLSILSDRLLPLTRALEQLGFFQATEQSGMVYHLWTSALSEEYAERDAAEETLLKVLKTFQAPFTPNYIG